MKVGGKGDGFLRILKVLLYLLFIKKSRGKPIKNGDKIVALPPENSSLSAVTLVEKISISAKSVEKHFANLKVASII